MLLGRRREVLEKAGVPGALTYAGDLSEPEVVRGVARFVAEEFGTVDVLVHSAGGNGTLEPRSAGGDALDAVAHDWTVNFRGNTLSAAMSPRYRSISRSARSRQSSPSRLARSSNGSSTSVTFWA